MTMKRKTAIVLMSAWMISALAGCQLAAPETGESVRDKLVGVFVTLVDIGQPVNPSNPSAPAPERVYAERVEKTDIDEDGDVVKHMEFVFPGLEGMRYMAVTILDPTDLESYSATIADEGLSELATNWSVKDEENNISLEGTLFLSGRTDGCFSVYLNPVYQSADGSIFLTPAGGDCFGGNVENDGWEYGETLNETNTITELGETKTEEITVLIKVRPKPTPEKIAVMTMDADSRLLSRDEYVPGELPKTLTPEKGAAYLVVETHGKDSSGKQTISRDLYSKGAEEVTTYHARPDRICLGTATPITWQD